MKEILGSALMICIIFNETEITFWKIDTNLQIKKFTIRICDKAVAKTFHCCKRKSNELIPELILLNLNVKKNE